MLVPQMPNLPGRQPQGSIHPISTGAPKRLKRAKKPASQRQRSAQARVNAKNATRDQSGKFAKKSIFAHLWGGVKTVARGVKKTHRTVKKVSRTVKRAFKSQPVPRTTPRKSTRKRAKTPAQVARAQQKQRVPGYRGSVIRQLFGL